MYCPYSKANTPKLNAAFTIRRYRQNFLIKLGDSSRRFSSDLAKNMPKK